jgi:predicted DNA-binding transcriptional regulator AlpA
MNQATTHESGTARAEGERLVRMPATLHALELRRTAWLEVVKSKQAPQPVKIGRATFWVWSEVQAFIADRIRKSRKG